MRYDPPPPPHPPSKKIIIMRSKPEDRCAPHQHGRSLQGCAGFHGRHICPPKEPHGSGKLSRLAPRTRSRAQAITQQTFRASSRAPHARPPALFACRCLPGARSDARPCAPGQSPLCAAWLFFFFFPLPLASFLSFLPFGNVLCPLSASRLARLSSPAGGLFLKTREALPASCWEPGRRGCGAGVEATGGKCPRPL